MKEPTMEELVQKLVHSAMRLRPGMMAGKTTVVKDTTAVLAKHARLREFVSDENHLDGCAYCDDSECDCGLTAALAEGK